MISYEEIGRAIGALVDEKNKAYGSSFHHAGEVLKIIYPEGLRPDQYQRMLYTVRVIDKLFRLATQPEAFGENPAKDIAGYSILMSSDGEKVKA
jgi:hypothetical protein